MIERQTIIYSFLYKQKQRAKIQSVFSVHATKITSSLFKLLFLFIKLNSNKFVVISSNLMSLVDYIFLWRDDCR